jgi:glycosyltransferase involved in cell wall biosynthesis
VKAALIGNTAWNSSILARGLRLLGVEADSFDKGGGYFGQMPHWERGLFSLRKRSLTVRDVFWGWDRIKDERTGQPIPREPWEKIIGNDLWAADPSLCKPWYDTQEDFQRDAANIQLGWNLGNGHTTRKAHEAEVFAALEHSRTPQPLWPVVAKAAALNAAWRTVNKLATDGGYDLLVLFGEFATCGPLLPKDVPYLTFEHGTMRYVSSLLTDPRYLAAALGYQLAEWNVITNADVWTDAGNLGIRHKSSFIPHPFDESRFTPGEDAARRHVLTERLGAELLFLAPARHSSTETAGSKRNDRILHAFARYVREAEPQGAPKAGLIFLLWGDPKDYDASDKLAEALGLGGRVVWHECVPRPELAQLYRAADVVLDQFSDTVGSFGTTTVEAMSSGKPVISYYNPDVHTWCLDVLGEHPPILTARTVDEIYERLVWQAKHPESRASIGKRGREWVLAHHGLEQTSRRFIALFERVLAKKAQSYVDAHPEEAKDLVTV